MDQAVKVSIEYTVGINRVIVKADTDEVALIITALAGALSEIMSSVNDCSKENKIRLVEKTLSFIREETTI